MREGRHTEEPNPQPAAYVDAHLAPFAHKVTPTRIEKAVDAAVLHHDPERAALLAERAGEGRKVHIDHHGAIGPADMLVADSASTIYATVDTPDALAFEDAVAALAAALGDLLRRFRGVAGDHAPYNLVLHSAPPGVDDFHWHLHLLPRLTTYGGFELGTGVIINVVDPDRAADALRSATGS